MKKSTARHFAEKESKLELSIKSLPSKFRESHKEETERLGQSGWRTPGEHQDTSESTKQGTYELTEFEAARIRPTWFLPRSSVYIL